MTTACLTHLLGLAQAGGPCTALEAALEAGLPSTRVWEVVGSTTAPPLHPRPVPAAPRCARHGFACRGCRPQAFRNVYGPLVAAVTLASEESKVTIQNRPTVVNTEYIGELRCVRLFRLCNNRGPHTAGQGGMGLAEGVSPAMLRSQTRVEAQPVP